MIRLALLLALLPMARIIRPLPRCKPIYIGTIENPAQLVVAVKAAAMARKK